MYKKTKILINADISEKSINAQDRNGKHWCLYLDSNKYDFIVFCSGVPDKRLAGKNNLSIINLILDKGANVNALDIHGKTIFDYCKDQNLQTILKLYK